MVWVTTRAAVAACAVLLVGGSWYLVGVRLANAKPVLAHPRAAATAVVWGGLVFDSQVELTRWLRRRGASYRIWGERHPPAQRVLLHAR